MNDMRDAHRSRARAGSPKTRIRRPSSSSTRTPRRSWVCGVEGNYDRVSAARAGRERCSRRGSSASPASRPSRSTAACAGRFTSSCRRRRFTALDLSGRSRRQHRCAPRTRTSRSARSTAGDTTYLLRSQGQFQNLDQIRDLVVLTQTQRAGLPARHRRSEGRHRRHPVGAPDQRQGRGVRMQVTKQSGTNTVQIAAGACARRSSASTARCPASS